jgi:hypothetical protein
LIDVQVADAPRTVPLAVPYTHMQTAITPTGLLTLFALISLTSKGRQEKMLTGSFTKRNDKKNGANKRYDELDSMTLRRQSRD